MKLGIVRPVKAANRTFEIQAIGPLPEAKGRGRLSNQDFELIPKENGGAYAAPPFLMHPL